MGLSCTRDAQGSAAQSTTHAYIVAAIQRVLGVDQGSERAGLTRTTSSQREHEKITRLPLAPYKLQGLIMDIERINVIGTTLSDLTQRTLDLRGYL